MSETVGFTPEQQAKVDEIVKQRVAREKEKWAKESGTADAVAQLEAKDREMDELKRAYRVGDARRAVLGELASAGVTDEAAHLAPEVCERVA